MNYLLLSFLAGLLTVFAPCVFTLLPVILGGSLLSSNFRKAVVISTSLAVSVLLFTLVLKVSSVFINVPATVWNLISGGIILILGIFTLFPDLWGQLTVRLGFEAKSNKLLKQASNRQDLIGEILTGAALGPVFSSCSPTYALIIATILPQDFATGLLNLIVYVLGLEVMLLLVSALGQKLVKRLKWAVNPKGWFKRGLGILFIIIGVLIITGFNQTLETALLNSGYFDVTKIETTILNNNANSSSNSSAPSVDHPALSVANPYPAPEFPTEVNWINSDALKLADLKGKVVLIDFWTYSCINCIRTLPYVEGWYAKYKDQGLVIIGVHTPEFAFEKVTANVTNFMKTNNVLYPVVQDNDYQIWNSFHNQSWPAEYFIDRSGNVVHTHFGEGEYDQSEMIIQYLLGNTKLSSDLGNVIVPINPGQSPETYLNYERGAGFVNAAEFTPDQVVDYQAHDLTSVNTWGLIGKWTIGSENSTSAADGVTLKYKFSAKEVYLVMGASSPKQVQVKLNGQVVTAKNKGDDVDQNGVVTVSTPQLYRLIKLPQFTTNQQLELTFPAGVNVNAFTFGG